MICYMCKYTPVELLAGFGEKPEHLDPSVDSFELADGLGHANLCGYGKGLIETVLQKDIQELVLVNCCDVVRRIYDILKAGRKMKFLFFLDVPHKRGPAEQRYLRRQLKKLAVSYAEYTGKEFDLRLALASFYGKTNREEPEKVISLQGAHGGGALEDMMRSCFSLPVRNDTCSGVRMLEYPFMPEIRNSKNRYRAVEAPLLRKKDSVRFGKEEELEHFLDLYAGILLNQKPCMRMLDLKQREENLAGAAGVIYHTMKFCDYYSFEYAKLKEHKEIPLLKLETDGTRQSEGQLSTRLEAFSESLHLNRENRMMARGGKYYAGIDSGSTSTDVVILDKQKKMVSWSIIPTGAGAAAGADRALKQALDQAGITEEELCMVISTGYGRETIGKGDKSITEITCHARGANYLDPDVRTIIDIGGQDSKVIRIDGKGAVQNFVMNDKCAAGTGRFLEMMARTMGYTLEEMSALGAEWKKAVTISSMCTVFAESEVVSLVAQNTAPADIIHGLNLSVAAKTSSLVKRVGGEKEYMMTGGVAQNSSLVKVMEEKLGVKIRVSEYSQLCGAIGAALLAME